MTLPSLPSPRPLALLLASLAASGCFGSTTDDCPPYYVQQGAAVTPRPGEAGQAKIVRDQETHEGALGFGDESAECLVVHGSQELDGPTAASIPTLIEIQCALGSGVGVGVGVRLPDLRGLGVGTHDAAALGATWSVLWSPDRVCPPDSTNDACTVTATPTTFALTVDEATGASAPAPANVTDDFRLAARLELDLAATWSGHTLTATVTLPFTQAKADYVDAEKVMDQGACE